MIDLSWVPICFGPDILTQGGGMILACFRYVVDQGMFLEYVFRHHGRRWSVRRQAVYLPDLIFDLLKKIWRGEVSFIQKDTICKRYLLHSLILYAFGLLLAQMLQHID